MMSYTSVMGPGAVGCVGVIAVLVGCAERPAASPPDPIESRPSATDSPPAGSGGVATNGPAGPPAAAVYYQPIAIDSGRPFRRLVRELGPDRLTLLLKLNRVDLEHLRAGDTLYLPSDSLVGPLEAAPFPGRVPALDSFPKFLLVAQEIQAFAAYELGHLVFWGPTSTGKRSTPTPNGFFHTTWKAKETRSTDNEAWLLKWYFNFENFRGVSFHQYDLPGQPASHACVRLLAEDAEWIYRWADQWRLTKDGATVVVPGTPVLVFGDYRFGEPGPWRRLGDNPAAASVTAEAIAAAMASWGPKPAAQAPADSTR